MNGRRQLDGQMEFGDVCDMEPANDLRNVCPQPVCPLCDGQRHVPSPGQLGYRICSYCGGW